MYVLIFSIQSSKSYAFVKENATTMTTMIALLAIINLFKHILNEKTHKKF